MSPKVTLYMFPGSNAVYTARLMLDHKGIDYKLVKMLPGVHAITLLARGFPTMAAPALKADGVRVQGTRWIARALDGIVPERPLFPADPVQRRAVEDAERWGEGLQNATRRIFYCLARRDHRAFTSLMTAERGPVKRIVVRMSAPIVLRLAAGVHRATDEHGREDVELLPERLDLIDAWIEEGLLNGPELNAADFQIAANVAALMLADDLRPFIEGRPAAALARRVAPAYQGHIERGLPREWLEPLRTSASVREAERIGAPA
ncbi:MAG: glutathione S-transferase [Solirubrobacteraceae bacterium]|jgi:glutathione S-transferase|nr:glutathione S-transferase [Solirubrobacteraceae bacterium]